MAELVQRHMESMAEEIEEMRRTKVFTPEECRLILKQRKELEYKVNRVSKDFQDFMDYIKYEKTLIKQIHNRRDKHRISERKSGIEYKIRRRVKNLYQIALPMFSSNFRLWLDYFQFCKESNFLSTAAMAVINMVRACAQDPEVWQVAAAWYAHDRNDVHAALKVLNKGLAIHKNNPSLYKEAIKLELSTVDGIEDNEAMKAKLALKVESYVKFSLNNINECEYLVEILNLLEQYPFCEKVQHFIIGKLMEDHSDKALVWHALAQREKRGVHYDTSEGEIEEFKDMLDSGDQFLDLCFVKYQEGLKKVPETEKTKLFSFYFDCLTKVKHGGKKFSKNSKMNLLNSALKKAADEKYLSENHYITWLELVSDEEAHDILVKGTLNIPGSLKLWNLRLRYATMTKNDTEVGVIFNEAIQKLNDQSLPLWLMYLQYYESLSRNDIVDSIYCKGVTQVEVISEKLKCKYIEWVNSVKGIDETRKVYRTVADKMPFCKQLHETMSKLEYAQENLNIAKCVEVHELACRQFGREDIGVWIRYIQFYLHTNICDDAYEKIERICREAKNNLPPLMHSAFHEQYMTALSDSHK